MNTYILIGLVLITSFLLMIMAREISDLKERTKNLEDRTVELLGEQIRIINEVRKR